MDNFSSSDVGPNDNTTPWTGKPAFMEYSEFQAAMVIWKISTPIIILLGGFGNIATFFVMRRIKDHNSSQYAIFMALALSDFIVLCTATSSWLREVFRINLKIFHIALCKVLTWLVYVSGTSSAWLVTCVTIQRTMAVLWPHKMRVLCTVRRTWIVIVTLVLTACALNVHFLFGLEINKDNSCRPMQGSYRQFADLIFSWIDSCMASIFPSACLFVCDIILSYTLFQSVSSSSIAARGESSTDSRKNVSYRTTVMVLAISSAFLLLTLPVCVFLIWFNFAYFELLQDPKSFAMSMLVYAVTFQMWYANSAINFLLYCLTGTKFRREFRSWIGCGAGSSSAALVHETASETSKGGRHK